MTSNASTCTARTAFTAARAHRGCKCCIRVSTRVNSEQSVHNSFGCTLASPSQRRPLARSAPQPSLTSLRSVRSQRTRACRSQWTPGPLSMVSDSVFDAPPGSAALRGLASPAGSIHLPCVQPQPSHPPGPVRAFIDARRVRACLAQSAVASLPHITFSKSPPCACRALPRCSRTRLCSCSRPSRSGAAAPRPRAPRATRRRRCPPQTPPRDSALLQLRTRASSAPRARTATRSRWRASRAAAAAAGATHAWRRP